MANPKVSAQYQAHVGKTPFNESCSLDFSSAPGMILPVYYCRLDAGEDFSGTVIMESRTEDLNTKTFTRIHEFCDWFFVPHEQIMKEFGSWYTQVDDVQSSLYRDFDRLLSELDSPLPYIASDDCFSLYAYEGNIQSLSQYLQASDFDSYGSRANRWRALRAYLESQVPTVDHPYYIDKFGYASILGTIRLYELLGHRLRKSPQGANDPYSSGFHFYYRDSQLMFQVLHTNKGVENLLLWATYQKIYMDYFRDSDYEVNDRFAYNLDRLTVSENAPMGMSRPYSGGLFQLRYRRWNVMYQNNFLPSPLQSIVGMLGQTNNSPDADKVLMQVNQWLQQVSPFMIEPDGGPADTSDSNPTSIIDERIFYNSPVSMDTLYALRKISEVTRRAGKHYDDQILAHFGVKIPRQVSGEVYHIGQHHNLISLAQVVSQSDTKTQDGGAFLGEIGGKGYGISKGDQIKFRAPVSGYIMCVTSAMPEVIMPYGTDKNIRKVYRKDFPHPATDRLGMQPLFEDETRITDSESARSTILAWQYRNLEEKMKYDRSAGNLGLGGNRSYWAPNLEDLSYSDTELGQSITSLRYVSPNCMDSFMKVKYDTFFMGDGEDEVTYFLDQVCAYDPLIHHFEFKCTRNAFMSAYGLPEL